MAETQNEAAMWWWQTLDQAKFASLIIDSVSLAGMTEGRERDALLHKIELAVGGSGLEAEARLNLILLEGEDKAADGVDVTATPDLPSKEDLCVDSAPTRKESAPEDKWIAAVTELTTVLTEASDIRGTFMLEGVRFYPRMVQGTHQAAPGFLTIMRILSPSTRITK